MNSKTLYINGKWTESHTGNTRTIIDPANRHSLAEVAEGDREDTRLAISAARNAFDNGKWPQTPPERRAELVIRLGDLIEQNREELARLETLNTGKTLEESRWDMDDIAEIFRYFGKLATTLSDRPLESPIANSTSLLVKEPIGVCGQISPWNYPLLQAAWKLAPALAAGCTMVVKPSELTPLTTISFVELTEQVGLPEGVVNLILGSGPETGAELAESPDVDLISFTGGIVTGKKIIRSAAANVKKIALELGGKNPNIIFADADFDTALDQVLNGVFFHAGQICSAGARVMVEKPIHDRFVRQLRERMEKIVIGNGMNGETQMGPLISATHREKVEEYVKIGREEGARLLLGGARPSDPELQEGFYYLPTLFSDCRNEMRIVQEEVFGPVITVESFTTEEEAVEKANSTIYGLSAGFWTNDQERMRRVSRALRFGTVWINDFNIYFAQAPWGGYKQSGMGRELGEMGLDEYLESKHIFTNHQPQQLNWFGK